MKISTRGRYALKMMIEFAMNEGKPTKIIQVANSQGISEKYLEQIVSLLVKAGFVKGQRGANGGYTLAKEIKAYSVGDILRVTEGSLAPISCLEDNYSECDKAHICVSRNLFKKIDDAITEVVDNINLKDLLDEELKNLKYYETQDFKRGCCK